MLEISISSRLRPTPFHTRVVQCGAKAFTVYNHTLLPTVFESIESDYWHLLQHVQLWDVSCEKQVELVGPDARKLAQLMTPRNLSSCAEGQCMYAPLVNSDGRMINDPVILKFSENHWWLSVADSDALLWAMGIATGRNLNVSVTEPDVYPLAVQGPKSASLMQDLCGDWITNLGFFRFRETSLNGIDVVISRSGFSKQGGFEIYLKGTSDALPLWDMIFEAGQTYQIRAGCPNFIERVEGGLLSYGNEMTLAHNPFECGLDGFCDLNQENEVLCLDALRKIQKTGPEQRLIGVEISGPQIKPMSIWTDIFGDSKRVGHVTSAVHSPRLKKNIGMAMVKTQHLSGENLSISIDAIDRELTQVSVPFN